MSAQTKHAKCTVVPNCENRVFHAPHILADLGITGCAPHLHFRMKGQLSKASRFIEQLVRDYSDGDYRQALEVLGRVASEIDQEHFDTAKDLISQARAKVLREAIRTNFLKMRSLGQISRSRLGHLIQKEAELAMQPDPRGFVNASLALERSERAIKEFVEEIDNSEENRPWKPDYSSLIDHDEQQVRRDDQATIDHLSPFETYNQRGRVVRRRDHLYRKHVGNKGKNSRRRSRAA